MKIRWLCALGLALHGCYDPTVPQNLSCEPDTGCPGTLVCHADGVCRPAKGDTPIPETGECLSASRTYEFSGVIEELTIPDCVELVTIEAVGAGGGGGVDGTGGGAGARLRGDFPIQAFGDNSGLTLHILVGQRGADATDTGEQAGGSGGGGSFVATRLGEPLLVAGGGGGATNRGNVPVRPGGDATLVIRAGDGGGAESTGTGGDFGGGGTTHLNDPGGFHTGTGGGGFLGNGIGTSNGDAERFGTPNTAGVRFLDGGSGGRGGSLGRDGGFGGGGAAGFTGGGGGGYSGGGSADVVDAETGGGGGGSFNDGANQEGEAGVSHQHGRVTISWEGS